MDRADRQGRCFTVSVALGIVLFGSAAPAQAEVGATFSFFSEARLRGISLSAGHPIAQLDLSYDDPGGFYGSLSASTVLSSEYGLRPLGLEENLGYAKKLKSGPSIDVGGTLQAIEFGDFNHDGKIDMAVVVANPDNGAHQFEIELNQGGGSFHAAACQQEALQRQEDQIEQAARQPRPARAASHGRQPRAADPDGAHPRALP